MNIAFIFLYIALAFLIALFSTRLMHLLKLPNVTGFIITGILIGPYVFGLLFSSFTEASDGPINQIIKTISWISDFALGFIAFSIGSSFKMSSLRKVGKQVIIITILESLFASLFVLAALLVTHFIWPNYITLPLVLTLAAIAAATAPAATLMVIKQYKAKGPVVNTLLPVVALDDASALILFAILFQIAKTIGGASSGNVFYSMVGKPIIEIILSLVLGAILGFVLVLANKIFKSRANRLTWVIFVIVLTTGLCALLENGFDSFSLSLSSLLVCMMAGAIYVNYSVHSVQIFDMLDRFTSPIFMLFFVISGASLNLSIFASDKALYVIIAALVYVIFRVIGKYLGAFTGANISKSEKTVKKYLGFTLIPQAGVAIGLSTKASAVLSNNSALSETGAMIIAIVLTSTLIYELIGPLITKKALEKANEITK